MCMSPGDPSNCLAARCASSLRIIQGAPREGELSITLMIFLELRLFVTIYYFILSKIIS